MQNFSLETWLLFGVIAFACLTAILWTLASQFGQERDLFDLKREVSRLREAYRKRLADDANEIIEVDEAPEYAESGSSHHAEGRKAA